MQYWVRHTRARAVPFYFGSFLTAPVRLKRLNGFSVECLTVRRIPCNYGFNREGLALRRLDVPPNIFRSIA